MQLTERELIEAEEKMTKAIEEGKASKAIVKLFKIIRKLNDR